MLPPLDRHQGSDWSARCHCQGPVAVAAVVLRPLRHRLLSHVGTSSMQLSWPLHRRHHRSTLEEQGAPVRKHPDLTPPCRIAAPTQTDVGPTWTLPPLQLSISEPSSTAIHRVW
jgi:hypothetical protein